MHFEAVFNASLHGGNLLTRYFQLPTEGLNAIMPETAEDYLCRGFTMGRLTGTRRYKAGRFPRGQGLDDIDKAIAMRDTAIARFFRALVAREIEFTEQDLLSVERKVADIQQAKRRLLDNKFVRFKSLHSQLQIADRYQAADAPEKRKAALEEAGRDAQELKGIPSLMYVKARVFYFDHIGDGEAALKELDWASHQPETSDLVSDYALALYERGRDAEALRVLDAHLKPTNSAAQMLRIILWAELPEVGPDKAYDRYLKLVASRNEPGWNGPIWTPHEFDALMLLGKRKEAMDRAASPAPFLPLAKYFGGELTEEEYLQAAAKAQWSPTLVHYPVALVRLSNGDRAGARDQFQKTLDGNFYPAAFYPYARAFLARMKRDPEWPRWIPVRK
jgi:hypothetical protein